MACLWLPSSVVDWSSCLRHALPRPYTALARAIHRDSRRVNTGTPRLPVPWQLHHAHRQGCLRGVEPPAVYDRCGYVSIRLSPPPPLPLPLPSPAMSYAPRALALPCLAVTYALSISMTVSALWPSPAPYRCIRAENFLGVLDTAFMFAYALGLFVSGRIGDKFNLRYVRGSSMPGLMFTRSPCAVRYLLFIIERAQRILRVDACAYLCVCICASFSVCVCVYVCICVRV